MKQPELVFVPLSGIGHTVSAVELAKALVDRDDRLCITILIMNMPFDSKTIEFAKSLANTNTCDRIRFIELPRVEFDPSDTSKSSMSFLIDSHKPHVREAVSKLIEPESSPDSPRLAGFFVDMFCTKFMDVANEFGVPTYVFFTTNAAYLGLMLHMQSLHDEQQVDLTEIGNSDVELSVPTTSLPIPAKVLPAVMLRKHWLSTFFLQPSRAFREARGIVVNTFEELEPYAVNALTTEGTSIPPIYPVGPILNTKSNQESSDQESIMQWLDDQAPSSVVFLCFGSMGTFDAEQVKEMALALERSEHHFLWSLRPPSSIGRSEYSSPDEVLPEGFLDRTANIGKLIGWAPQVSVLAHKAVGGFVSHCGWNSTLESLWFGVPTATFPIYAEQQFNAFRSVKELGLGVEITLDYKRDIFGRSITTSTTVSADVIEKGIKSVMEGDSQVRKKVKEMSKKSRRALMEGGSSHSSLGRLIQDVINNYHSLPY
ncbi:hypothetical protein K2173_018013 [Erythroxylum novogranatense]|uniref:Glycosyltransferase n=1 Tax=Erythroxylum novogranatense TaxID=1862640 RepID=A0AAV8TUG7_9ROSI|nr:hypothetical protein K2173_018013 [Erythroxylum novogranatense]